MRRFLIAPAILVALVGSTIPGHASSTATPLLEGPDVVPVTAPIAVATPFDHEYFTCTEAVRTRTIALPSVPFDRVILEFTATPDGDPWDRLFGVSLNGVEVLRGTTPRTEFTLRRDITEYAGALSGTAEVGLMMGTYVGAMLGTVHVEFYANEPTAALVRAPANAIGAFTWGRLNGKGARMDRGLVFPAGAPSSGAVEITLSGHGAEEFWYRVNVRAPRAFHVLADGQEIAVARALPYVYALVGTGNANANTACAGPGTSAAGDIAHPLMWWTAQRGLDAAGVHTGVGEIPPYRADIDASGLALLAGARTISVVQEDGAATWVTSLSFLLHA